MSLDEEYHGYYYLGSLHFHHGDSRIDNPRKRHGVVDHIAESAKESGEVDEHEIDNVDHR